MSEPRTPAPVYPIVAAIKPVVRKVRGVFKLYREMAWRPRQFAEERIRTPASKSISTAVKHTIWIGGFWSGLVGLQNELTKFPGDKPIEAIIGKSFVFVGVIALTSIPIALVLWLLTRAKGSSLSRTLLIVVHSFNLQFGALMMLLAAMVPVTVPLVIILYVHGLWPDPTNPSFVGSHSFWIIWSFFIPAVIVQLYIFYRTFLIVPPNLIAGTFNVGYWAGLWRYVLSYAFGSVPYCLLFFSLVDAGLLR